MNQKNASLYCRKNDYIIQVKHRRKRLTKLLKECIKDNEPISKGETKERNRGRKEHRILCLYEPNEELTTQWAGLKKVISIRRIRTYKNSVTDSTHYYITSLKSNDSKLYLEMIRKHWWIENKLHYVKDVILREDSTSFKTYDRIKRNAVYRNVILNCFKLNGLKSIKQAIEKCAGNIELCVKLIRT